MRRKIFFLFFSVCSILNLEAQEPDRVIILHQDVIRNAYAETFDKTEIKEVLNYSFTIQLRIMDNGRVCDGKIGNIDSASLLFKRKEKFLRIVEDKMRIKFYSQSFKKWIKRSKKAYCISLLVSKGVIFDYENEPFLCN